MTNDQLNKMRDQSMKLFEQAYTARNALNAALLLRFGEYDVLDRLYEHGFLNGCCQVEVVETILKDDEVDS